MRLTGVAPIKKNKKRTIAALSPVVAEKVEVFKHNQMRILKMRPPDIVAMEQGTLEPAAEDAILPPYQCEVVWEILGVLV